MLHEDCAFKDLVNRKPNKTHSVNFTEHLVRAVGSSSVLCLRQQLCAQFAAGVSIDLHDTSHASWQLLKYTVSPVDQADRNVNFVTLLKASPVAATAQACLGG